MPKGDVEHRQCKHCQVTTPHVKFRPGDRPGYYWRCLYCGASDIDGDGNEPVLAT